MTKEIKKIIAALMTVIIKIDLVLILSKLETKFKQN